VLSHARAYGDSGSWDIRYDDSDLTSAASPIPVGASVLLNTAGIGPMLGLTVVPDPSGFTIQAADGKRWHWETGATSVSTDSQVISLTVPGMQEGATLYLDPQAISELCRVPVTIDDAAKQIVFRRTDVAHSTQIEQASLPDGWLSFAIAKPKTATTQKAQAILSPSLATENLPPSHDRLNIGVGLGYVEGADLGLELTSSGKLAGGDLSLSVLATDGELGPRVQGGHLLWLDKQGRRGIEAGDMYSETWGLVQGIRYLWNVRGNHWPALSLNLGTDRTLNRSATISYLDEFKLMPGFTFRGEIGTDRATYANVRYDRYPLQVFAFSRTLSGDLGSSQGMFGSLSLSRAISLFYGVTETTNEFDERSIYRNAGVRIPLLKRWGLVLGQTEYENDNTSSTTRSVGLTIPLPGGVHVYFRYQNNSWDTGTIAGQLINLHNDEDSLLTSLSLFATPRIHLDYQRNQMIQEGRTAYYEQLITNYRLSPTTNLQAITGFPNLADPNVLRLRLDHRLNKDTSLVVDYGRLSPYQSKDDIFGKRGFMVMVRKTWPVSVPARGGNVSGVVTDHSGKPLPAIAVRMGTYTTVSDANGRYSFACTPAGKYKIGIPDDMVPAEYKVETTAQQIDVARDSRQTVDFKLIPYGCILGRVYMDRNGNNSYDPGEGVADIPVASGKNVTATDMEGRFGFFNLDPGRYLIRIPMEYLDKKYTVHGSMATAVDLPPMGSVTNVVFRLEIKKKPVIYANLE
jgi:hypothetical protein